MAVFNAAKREIDIKIVYYGPALCGKTTNVQCVHKMLSPAQRGDIMSLATKDDRTLFFDFLPIELGDVKGFKTRFHVYTVPGQVYYALTRRAVLTGVDGVVFVADSQASKLDENIESLQDLNDNLNYYKKDLNDIPFIMQYNKRDMDNILPVAELDQKINPGGVPYFAASAVDGTGVIETLTACCKLVLKQMDSSGGTKKRRHLRQEEKPSAGDIPPSTVPAQPPSPSEEPSSGLLDDDGPVVKIIPGDEYHQPAQTQPAAPKPLLSDIDSAPSTPASDFADSPYSAQSDVPTMDAQPVEPLSKNETSETYVPDVESMPSLDSFDSGAVQPTPPVEPSEPVVEKQEIIDSVFANAAHRTAARDIESQPSAQPEPYQSVPIEDVTDDSSGEFIVTECGSPQKISSKAVNLPVTLKNSRTGLSCSITVTVSFDNFRTS